jgi:hypothetical protein
MAGWGKGLVDMARSTEEKISAIEESMPVPTQAADYPWGLRLSLDEADLEKLGLDASCEVGDTLHFVGMAAVTSVSKNEFNGTHSCRVELQVQRMAVENEDEEAMAMTKRYGKR